MFATLKGNSSRFTGSITCTSSKNSASTSDHSGLWGVHPTAPVPTHHLARGSEPQRFTDIPYALIPGGLSPVDLATWAFGQFRAKCPSSLHRKHLFAALSSTSSSLLNAYFGPDALANHFGLDDPGLFHWFSFQTTIGGLADSQGEIDMLLLRPRSQPSPGTPPPEPLHPTPIIWD
ncbi:hypothetical protein E4T56_gene15543 [Termitomyces sp. T112]|nr:hypothetical protein E4T56_gene15543 [Termitomyces sp. T112]